MISEMITEICLKFWEINLFVIKVDAMFGDKDGIINVNYDSASLTDSDTAQEHSSGKKNFYWIFFLFNLNFQKRRWLSFTNKEKFRIKISLTPKNLRT